MLDMAQKNSTTVSPAMTIQAETRGDTAKVCAYQTATVPTAPNNSPPMMNDRRRW